MRFYEKELYGISALTLFIFDMSEIMKEVENSYIEPEKKESNMAKRRLVDISANRDIENSPETHQRRKDVKMVNSLLFNSSVWDNTKE